MFGLEKKPSEKFAFDLEKEIKNKPERKKEILAKVSAHIHEIKQLLREGANEKDFERLGFLLNAYLSLQKVLTKINT
ncbi:MAG: EscE/YscE/SsaE family type III secretion system needle protein co-chaperone [Chlamydiales bacterium]|nr:EscE/YscE/SsaE family type III secretion system needle protein co-chaperone [Chlamydiales bacterium]